MGADGLAGSLIHTSLTTLVPYREIKRMPVYVFGIPGAMLGGVRDSVDSDEGVRPTSCTENQRGTSGEKKTVYKNPRGLHVG